jgi:CRP-like cAMP-binding protein
MASSQEFQKLTELPLLKSMPRNTLERVANLLWDISEKVVLVDGDLLLHEGDLAGETGYVLLDGAVQIEKQNTAPVVDQAPTLLGEMHQFNPHAQRMATVRAKGRASALKFSWRKLYHQAKAVLTEGEQTALMDGMERCVCERLEYETVMDLRLLRGLRDPLKVRVWLALQWIAQRLTLPDGAVLFEQGRLCGDTGYLVTRGDMEIRRAGLAVHVVHAPGMLGVLPQFVPDLRWTATASAKGNVELLKFSWLALKAILQQRLSAEDLRQFNAALENAAEDSFVH